jgi:UDP-N-acetylglucosamine--dolichyl-phosphate N-acetylglucosaminephosphotransferase
MEILLWVPIFLGFLCTLLIMPIWIRKAKEIGLVWEDMNKPRREKNVAGSGGIIVVLGTMVGIFSYAMIQTFYFKSGNENLTEILAALLSIAFVAGIGLIDDLTGWKRGGLSIRSRLILILFSAMPLMIISFGESTVFGISFGIAYPLLLVPIGIVGATVTFNFLAGFNGLESSQGILLLSGLSIASYLKGNPSVSVIGAVMIACLAAFYIFNKNPAKVFPGNVMTYSIGAMIAIMAVLGDIEEIAVFFFIPYIIEMVLKSRGRLKKHSFGKPNEDGSLEIPYEKIYGLEHAAIWILKKLKPNRKVYEKEVVWLINAFQIVIIAIGFIIFF